MLEDKILNDDYNFEIKEEYLLDLNKKLDKKNFFLKKLAYAKFLVISVFICASVISVYTIFYPNKGSNIENLKAVIDDFKINKFEYNNDKRNSIDLKESSNEVIETKNISSSEKFNGFSKNNNSNKNEKLNSSSKNILLSNYYLKVSTEKDRVKKLNENFNENTIKENFAAKSDNSKSLFKKIKHEDLSLDIPIDFSTLLDLSKNKCQEFLNLDKIRGNNKKSGSVINFKKRWSFSLLVGVNSSKNILSNYSNKEYGEKRNKEEKRLTNTTFSLLGERLINDKLKFSLGLNYTSYGSKNEYSPSIIKRNIDAYFLDTIGTNIRSFQYFYLGSWHTVYDTLYSTNVKDTTINFTELDSSGFKNRGQTKFSYIELPFMIGYYKQSKKWNYGFNIGMSFGILTKKSGYVISQNLDEVLQASSKKIILNFLASPEVSYGLTHNFKIGLQPMIKLNLNNLSTNNYTNVRHLNFQLNTKLTYDF